MADITKEEFSIPGFTSSMGSGAKKYMGDYTVKYGKFDLDDLTDLSTLSEIETRAIRGDDIVLLTKDKMSFMAQYYLIISYLEKTT